MSSFTVGLLESVTSNPPQQAWSDIADHLWETFSTPITSASVDSEIVKRDRSITELENTLSGSCWDLWNEFEDNVPKASAGLAEFWNRVQGGKAILILDGVSLREAPWLLEQARVRGFTVHSAGPRAAELPCETSPFAKSLGFSQRSALENNGAGGAHKLPGATTESTNLNWKDCISLVGTQQGIVFWHHFPDIRMHDLSVPGEGLHKLAREAHEHFTSDDFWAFVERLATGRRLMITSDHGYAACGLFPDLGDKDQSEYMKKLFKSGRTATSDNEDGAWVPPIDLQLGTCHGSHRYVLGRRKWKSSGGYPTLHHGGLSLLEVFVPFIELSK
ncbi:hypothetical protein [Planctomicrobium sp. SH527]|uniref:hypothetical protein n=1 Tax=Planctomicrobium sp. SH527 TaxID=3448123 RepID=UPI003F5AEE75